MRFLALTFLVLITCDIPSLPHFSGGTHQPGPDGYLNDAAIGPDITGSDTSATDTPVGEVCTPNCYAKSCGPDGCGDVCGVCPADTACSYDYSTCIPKAMQKPYGEACSPNEFCKPYLKNSSVAVNYYKNYDWPKCLNDQCRDGPCLNFRCSQSCDNPQDPADSRPKDTTCPENAKCVPWDGKGACLPDAGYKICSTDTDCAANEACTPMSLNGQWELRCTPAWGDKVFGEACNIDPDHGRLVTCRTGLCVDKLCSRVCADDTDCLTPDIKCKDKKCPDGRTCAQDTDCSAFQCKNTSIDTNEAFDLCVRKSCDTNIDCPSGDYCRPAIWSQGYGSRCDPVHEGGAAYGDTCDDRHPCAEKAMCLNKHCTKLCSEDADCDFGLCVIAQQDLRAIVPYMGSATVPFAVCDPMRGSLTPCKGDADCDNEVCRTVIVMKNDGKNPPVPKKNSICAAIEPQNGLFGVLCGTKNHDIACASGLCVDSVPDQSAAGYCAASCVNQDDCPDFMATGTDIRKTVCNLRPILSMGTPNPMDDVLAGVCQPAQRQSSLDDCSATLSCPNAEVCAPYIQGYPGGAAIKLYCVTPAPDEVMPGQGCDPRGNTVKCATGLCLPGQLPDTGICSMPCDSDSECQAIDPSMSCVSRTILPAMSDLKLNMCSPSALCTTCMDDSDCMKGYACVNTAMGSWPSDYRCMPTCAKPADCPNNGMCMSLPSPAGNSGGANHDVCADIVCP